MNQEKLSVLNEAIQLVGEACQMVDDVMSDSPNKNHYEAYGKYGFNQLLGDGNPYDSSLYSILEEMEKDDSCEECGSRVESPGNTLCDSCNNEYEKRCDAHAATVGGE